MPMEAVKRKRGPPTTIDNWLQHGKKRKSEPHTTEAAEKPPLQELLDFSSLMDASSIAQRFDQVGNALLHDYLLVVRCGDIETEFKILELEFYLQKAGCHEDPFTHGSEEQKVSGRWCVFFATSRFPLLTLSQVLSSCPIAFR